MHISTYKLRVKVFIFYWNDMVIIYYLYTYLHSIGYLFYIIL